MQHTEIAIQYANDVIDGTIPACEYVRLACQRHLDDLERIADPDYPYTYDVDKAGKACRFIERLPHVKGQWAAGVNRIKLEPWQVFIVTSLFGWVKKSDGLRRFRYSYIEVPRKNGKALDVNTHIPTPQGWKRHGDLRPGDYVFAPNGQPVKVERVTEHYSGPCMEVYFSGGQKIVAHERHEWVTQRTWYTKRVRGFRDNRPLPPVETIELQKTLRGGSRGDFIHRVPIAKPLVLPDSDLPIPPYSLGAWLGDGTSRSGRITCEDQEIIYQINKEGIPTRALEKKDAANTYALSNGDRTQKARNNSFASKLRALNLLQNKHIPQQYIRASYGQRLELLRGLIDTDGHITKRGQIEIVTKYPALAAGIEELVCTLGMKPQTMIHGATCNGKKCGDVYRVMFFPRSDESLAYVQRKKDNQIILGQGKRRCNARTVINVQPVGNRVVNCIQVEGGLYLAGESFITTHNSVLAAGIGLYLFVADGEIGAEVYSGATTEKQAWEVFRPSKLMAQKAPGFTAHYGAQINAKTLCRLDDMSRFEPVIGNPGDGASPSCALVDEYHEHKTSDLHDTMQTGMAARQQPLMFIITTAGFNIGGPCYAKRADVIKTLQGLYDAQDVFGVIFTLDDGDDWTTRDALVKANPNFGVSVSEEFLLSAQAKAIQSAHEQNQFLTKHLDVWCSASAAYFNLQHLKPCEDRNLSLKEFKGEECIVGLDLASKIDMCAKVRLFRRNIDGDDHYYCFPTFYIPEETAQDPTKKVYLGWANAGLLTLTPGNITDYDYIEEDLKEDASRFVLLEVPFDPYNATHLANRMSQEGLEMVEYGQTVKNMSDPMKTLEAIIRAGRFHYDGNPVLTWMFSNVVAKIDAKDNVFPRKEREENKIDGVVACISALGRWLAQIDESGDANIRFL